MARRCLVLWVALLTVLGADARPLPPEQVPEILRGWIPWVMQGNEQSRCPFLFNDRDTRLCAWPGPLDLRLDERGGGFQLAWRTYAPVFVGLPGDGRHWPQALQVDGKPAVVLERAGGPAVELAPGAHHLIGQFAWDGLPESLPVPAEVALLSLQLDGHPVAAPRRDADGRLWLRARAEDATAARGDQLRIRVFRHLDDATPLLLTTRLLLDVSGKARELALPDLLPAGLLPLSLTAELPGRWEPDGTLRLQLRPGRWQVELTARSSGAVDALRRPAFADPWPAEEVWSFQAHTDQRLVEVAGAPALDPAQADVLEAWRALPAYLVEAGGGLAFRILRRGDPEPEPDALALQRQLWLDFDDGGYTASDRITGRLSRAWRLEVADGFEPGRASVDGEPRLITVLPGGRPGVELRHGNLDLSADGRMAGAIRHISATGWAQDFQQVATDLHLPPGWRLLAAAGMDNAPDTWVNAWTLLDLFVVLILSLAVGRLWGPAWGAAALAALVLLWQEPGAPCYVWLHLLAAIALLRVLPAGAFQRVVRGYRNLCWLALAAIALPFMAAQVRQGLYPQLEPAEMMPAAPAPMAQQETVLPQEQAPALAGAGTGRAQPLPAPAPLMAERKRAVNAEPPAFDPNARVQTGPGVPVWHWRSVHLEWTGPVAQGEMLSLYLLPPIGTLLANLLRIALLAMLAVRLADLIERWRPTFHTGGAVLALLPFLLALAPPAGADLPDDQRLEQLRERLLRAPECLPHCADFASLRLQVGPERLALMLEWHAAEPVAVPLPALAGEWLPEVVKVDGNADQGVLARDGDGLWLALPAGVHAVVLEGRLPAGESVRLPLVVRPHRAVAQVQGWRVEGVHADGQVDSQLRLLRQQPGATDSGPPELRPATLPPFVRLERTLLLGLDWRVHTRVLRLSPPGAAIALDIPLLPGEALTTAGLAVVEGKVAASLLPQQDAMEWDSVLQQRPELPLTAAAGTAWQEVWELRAGPIWHVQWQGIAPVHQQSSERLWAPAWYPRSGEGVVLHISRPEGVAGATLTIDSSRRQVRPGADASDTTLELVLRSSLGGQHTLTLPEGAQLRTVTIDGTLQPVRAKGREVVVPLHPGVQYVALEWREPTGMGPWYRLSAVGLGHDSVNSRVDLQLGEDRWLLFAGGPRLGPAVLFWGALLVFALAAAGLGRIAWTPLRWRHWLLLLVGFSQSSVYSGLVVVGWLLAVGWRRRAPLPERRWFNARQIILGLYTLAALALLFDAVSQGLLGWPDMQVAGNGSTAQLLQWYQDRSGPVLERPWTVTLPLYAYRALMLAWALWLAWALLDWLRWGWGCFAADGLWRAKPETHTAASDRRPA